LYTHQITKHELFDVYENYHIYDHKKVSRMVPSDFAIFKLI
jgi:hypothetical protein